MKSPALATGAVIVDLPGVHDANAARAAVAEGYSKSSYYNILLLCWFYFGAVRHVKNDLLKEHVHQPDIYIH